jgi:hypothetical protein
MEGEIESKGVSTKERPFKWIDCNTAIIGTFKVVMDTFKIASDTYTLTQGYKHTCDLMFMR